MKPIYKNLYQFTVYLPPMDFTIHQYLLASDPAILFATGTVQQAQTILPQIREILQDRPLKYIFVSHLESDECGGLAVFLKEYPEAQVICSGLTARELSGFGYEIKVIAGTPDSAISDGGLDLEFLNYPAEVHLQNGILCYEKNSGIFYSGDLMLRFGNGTGETMTGSWKDEIAEISIERIPNAEKLELLKSRLSSLSPEFVAVGHGFCIRCSHV